MVINLEDYPSRQEVVMTKKFLTLNMTSDFFEQDIKMEYVSPGVKGRRLHCPVAVAVLVPLLADRALPPLVVPLTSTLTSSATASNMRRYCRHS